MIMVDIFNDSDLVIFPPCSLSSSAYSIQKSDRLYNVSKWHHCHFPDISQIHYLLLI